MVAEVVLDGVLGDGGEAVLRVWELPAGQAAGALAESLPAVLRFAVGGLGAARVRWPGPPTSSRRPAGSAPTRARSSPPPLPGIDREIRCWLPSARTVPSGVSVDAARHRADNCTATPHSRVFHHGAGSSATRKDRAADPSPRRPSHVVSCPSPHRTPGSVMPQQYVYVTTHMHVEGPIPGPHSLLTLASAAHRADGS
ncbi:hypothetical protein ACFQV8_07895 [Pseudonocardia benzenivorans]